MKYTKETRFKLTDKSKHIVAKLNYMYKMKDSKTGLGDIVIYRFGVLRLKSQEKYKVLFDDLLNDFLENAKWDYHSKVYNMALIREKISYLTAQTYDYKRLDVFVDKFREQIKYSPRKNNYWNCHNCHDYCRTCAGTGNVNANHWECFTEKSEDDYFREKEKNAKEN